MGHCRCLLQLVFMTAAWRAQLKHLGWVPSGVLAPDSPWWRCRVGTSWPLPGTSAQCPQSGSGWQGSPGERGPAERAAGDSTDRDGRGNSRPTRHLPRLLLARCCMPVEQGCRAGSRREARFGLGWWEYLGSILVPGEKCAWEWTTTRVRSGTGKKGELEPVSIKTQCNKNWF